MGSGVRVFEESPAGWPSVVPPDWKTKLDLETSWRGSDGEGQRFFVPHLRLEQQADEGADESASTHEHTGDPTDDRLTHRVSSATALGSDDRSERGSAGTEPDQGPFLHPPPGAPLNRQGPEGVDRDPQLLLGSDAQEKLLPGDLLNLTRDLPFHD
jgi:hypothetical protein